MQCVATEGAAIPHGKIIWLSQATDIYPEVDWYCSIQPNTCMTRRAWEGGWPISMEIPGGNFHDPCQLKYSTAVYRLPTGIPVLKQLAIATTKESAAFKGPSKPVYARLYPGITST